MDDWNLFLDAIEDNNLSEVIDAVNRGISGDFNFAFVEATYHGNLEIVKYLVTLPQVNPCHDNHLALFTAAYENYLEIIKFFLTLPGMVEGIPRAFRASLFSGICRVANYLKTRSDFQVDVCQLIKRDRHQFNWEGMKILLSFPETDRLFTDPFMKQITGRYSSELEILSDSRLNYDYIDRIKVLKLGLNNTYEGLLRYPETRWLMIQDPKYDPWTRKLRTKLESILPEWRDYIFENNLQHLCLYKIIANL